MPEKWPMKSNIIYDDNNNIMYLWSCSSSVLFVFYISDHNNKNYNLSQIVSMIPLKQLLKYELQDLLTLVNRLNTDAKLTTGHLYFHQCCLWGRHC